MVRVLIADDSALTRKVLRDILEGDPGVRVVGEVADGRAAVAETCRLRPDLVIMDVVMPVLDGLGAIMEIMSCCPTPILVLSASVDSRECATAFSAIKHGALDVMGKPRGLASDAFGEIAAELVAKVKFLARIPVMHHFRKPRPVPEPPPAAGGRRSVLAIGASTGGPKAVLKLMRSLPQDLRASVLVVQHIASGFAPGFAAWLDRECPLPVRLAEEGMPLERGVALVAPNRVHMEVRGGQVALSKAPPVNSCRPSVDVLFRSLARRDIAPQVVAVLLTGMGRDGAAGMAALKEGGGYNIAQDEATSAIFGMPRAAIDLQAVNQTLPLSAIPAALLRLLT